MRVLEKCGIVLRWVGWDELLDVLLLSLDLTRYFLFVRVPSSLKHPFVRVCSIVVRFWEAFHAGCNSGRGGLVFAWRVDVCLAYVIIVDAYLLILIYVYVYLYQNLLPVLPRGSSRTSPAATLFGVMVRNFL